MSGKISNQPCADSALSLQTNMHEDIPFHDALFPVRILYNKHAAPPPGPPDHQGRSNATPILWHEQLEILCILEGTLVCECNFRIFEAKAGDLVVVNPCETHMFYRSKTPAVYHNIMVDLCLCGERDDIIVQKYVEPLLSGQISFSNHIPANETAYRIAKQLLEEYQSGQPGYEMAVKGYLFRLLTLFFRMALSNGAVSGNASTSIAPALHYIALHYKEDISLAELAEECFVNPSYFCRKFHKITGRTPIAYIHEYRLAKARVLLYNTTWPVSSIAAAVGYSDNGYFSRKFKEVYGISPRQLRRSEYR